MKHTILRKSVLVLFATTIALISSNALSQLIGTNSSILDVAIPNKTTLGEFEAAVKAKGCKYEAKLNDFFLPPKVKIEPGCFDLPGNPSIEAVAQAPDVPITNLAMRFPAENGKALYGQYMEILQKVYGKPNQEFKRRDAETAIWEPTGENMVVTLVNVNSTNEHFVAFVMGSAAKEARKVFESRQFQ